jgi:Glycosyl hydrolase family 71
MQRIAKSITASFDVTSRDARSMNRREAMGVLTGSAVAAIAPVKATPPSLKSGDEDLATVLPFDRGQQSSISGRRVFAHWNVFPTSFDNLPESQDYYAIHYTSPDGENGRFKDFGGFIKERPLGRAVRQQRDWRVLDMVDEIIKASDIGIDAFMFNILTINSEDALWKNLLNMLEAVSRVRTDFRIIPNIDGASGLGSLPLSDVIDALLPILSHPSAMKLPDGRSVIGAFCADGWTPARWRALFDGLAERAIKVSFMPVFLNPANAKLYFDLADVVSVWGGNYPAAVESLDKLARESREAGKQWMAPVWPQDLRPKDGWYAEASNSLLFRKGWRAAIDGHANCVQLITWNDYSESSEIRPSSGIQFAFYDLAAYYIAWFKNGACPKIVRDVLYYFHRTEPAGGSGLGTAQPNPYVLRFGERAVGDIELLGFLTAPGRLEIEVAGKIVGFDVPAGITSVRVPIGDGTPIFGLKRNGREVVRFKSAFPIRMASRYQDLLYKAGSSTRAIVQGAVRRDSD